MVTKKELLKDIRSYSPQDIAEAIKAGVVSIYELSKETEGAFTPLLKRQVKTALNATDSASNENLAQDSKIDTKNVVTDAEKLEIPEISTSQTIIEQSEIPVLSYTENDVNPDSENSKNITDMQVSPVKFREKRKLFCNIFSIKGRIRRTEYGLTYLACWLWNLPMKVLTDSEIPELYAAIYLLTFIPFIWILLAQGTKRCHDRGNSGWFQIIPFYFLWMIFAEGDSGVNKYGESPK